MAAEMKLLSMPSTAALVCWLAAAPATRAQIVATLRTAVPATVEVLAYPESSSFLSMVRAKDRMVAVIMDHDGLKGGLRESGDYLLQLYVTPKSPDFQIRLRFTLDPTGEAPAVREVLLDRVGQGLKATAVPAKGENKSRHDLTVPGKAGEPLIILK